MLKEQIKTDTVGAQKSGNELVVSTLRMLSAAILLKEKDKKFTRRSSFKMKIGPKTNLTCSDNFEIIY